MSQTVIYIRLTQLIKGHTCCVRLRSLSCKITNKVVKFIKKFDGWYSILYRQLMSKIIRRKFIFLQKCHVTDFL